MIGWTSIVTFVARMLRDVGLAEELAQDALVAALEHWPVDGVPDKPGAWLMTTAKNRARDPESERRMRPIRASAVVSPEVGLPSPTYTIAGCAGIVTTGAVANGSFLVTATGAGSCTLTVSDSVSNQATIAVGVSVLTVPIN